jgi:uncharacterized protein YecT (DUF1311 family)
MQSKFVLLGLLCLPFTAHSASFDCDKASTLVEKAICGDKELSDLDDTLQSVYKRALSQVEDAETLKSDQRNWLKNTRNKCKTPGCLKTAYMEHIEVLNDVAASAPSAPKKAASDLPKKVGKCVDAVLMDKTTRFEGAIPGEAGGELNMLFSNDLGVYVTSAPYLASESNVDKYLYNSRDFAKGDKVKICLVALPKDCPPGDDRGKIYAITNYKNKKSFTGVDAWHSCGGA